MCKHVMDKDAGCEAPKTTPTTWDEKVACIHMIVSGDGQGEGATHWYECTLSNAPCPYLGGFMRLFMCARYLRHHDIPAECPAENRIDHCLGDCDYADFKEAVHGIAVAVLCRHPLINRQIAMVVRDSDCPMRRAQRIIKKTVGTYEVK